jgi:hypothetical protein
MDKDKSLKFILEFKSLCEKYGLTIGGCGCCGSPSVEEGEIDLFHYLQDCDLIDVSGEGYLSDEDEKLIAENFLANIQNL